MSHPRGTVATVLVFLTLLAPVWIALVVIGAWHVEALAYRLTRPPSPAG